MQGMKFAAQIPSQQSKHTHVSSYYTCLTAPWLLRADLLNTIACTDVSLGSLLPTAQHECA
jgi:hypothetical protein